MPFATRELRKTLLTPLRRLPLWNDWKKAGSSLMRHLHRIPHQFKSRKNVSEAGPLIL
jgi:hypothetical protein